MLQSIPRVNRETIPPKAPTILLVEDEPFVREATRELLESAGFRVFTAEDAVDALHIFEEYRALIDLLMTDMVLPGSSGRELAREIRHRSPEVSVLITSGYSTAGYEIEDVAARVYFLGKPYSRRELLGKIESILGRTVRFAAGHAS